MSKPEPNPRPGDKPTWKDAAPAGSTKGLGPQQWSRGRRIFSVLAFMLVLISAVAVLLMLRRPVPKPHVLLVSIPVYEDHHLPVKAYAYQDRSLFGKEQQLFTNVPDPEQLQEAINIRDQLRKLREVPAETPVLFYFNGHVVPDEQGTLYLLDGKAQIDAPRDNRWISLVEVLNELKQCPSQKKLFVLDALQPLADPRLGVLLNDVPAQTLALLQQVEDEDRWVLLPCSPGQTALTSPELKRSVFNYFLEEGLRGPADSSGNGRISVRELEAYLKPRVDRWAWANRELRQTPLLIGPEGRDFDLVAVDKRTGPPPPPAADEEAHKPVVEYPPWLLQGWHLRDRWWREEVHRLNPRAYQQLEAELLRAEQFVRGGVPPEKLQDRLRRRLDDLIQLVRDSWRDAVRPEEPRSMALEAALPQQPTLALPPPSTPAQALTNADKKDGESKFPEPEKKPPDKPVEPSEEALRTLFEKLAGLPATPEAGEKRRQLLREFAGGFRGRRASELARVVFDYAVDDPQAARPERIVVLNQILKEAKQDPPQFVETLFLYRLEKALVPQPDPNRKVTSWPEPVAQAVRKGLKVVRDGERVASGTALPGAGWEPRAWPWLRAALEDAVQARHNAEVLLLSPGFASPNEAGKLYDQAQTLYDTAARNLQEVQLAYRTLSEAFLRLPVLAQALMHRDRADLDGWDSVVRSTERLAALLRQPAGEAAAKAEQLQTIEALAQELKNRLEPFVREASDETLQELLGQLKLPGVRPSQLARAEELLALPWITANKRKELWEAVRTVSADLNEKALSELATATATPLQPSDPDPRLELQRAARRARLALDLLKLAGVSGLNQLDSQVPAAREVQIREFPRDKALRIGVQLRDCWANRLQRLQDDGTSAREWLVRAAHPFDDLPANFRDPGQERLRAAERDWLAWLIGQYQYEVTELQNLGVTDVDPVPSRFYERTEAIYRKKVGAMPPTRPQLVVNLDQAEKSGGKLSFRTSKGQVVKVLITIRGNTSSPIKDFRLKALTPDANVLSLAVRENPAPWPEGQAERREDLTVEYQPSASSGQLLRGFVLQAWADGRAYHRLVETDLPEPEDRRPLIFVEDTPGKPSGLRKTELRIRPGGPQPAFVWIHNPTDQVRQFLVTLQHGNRRYASHPVTADPNDYTPVLFPEPTAAQPGAASAGGRNSMFALEDGQRLRFLLQEVLPDGKRLEDKPLDVMVTHALPSEYVTVERTELRNKEASGLRFLPDKRSLIVPVRLTDPNRVRGRECLVKLRLSDETRRDFRYESARLEGNLDSDNQRLELQIDDLQPREGLLQPGTRVRFYLDVDGYERAFVYDFDYRTSGELVQPRLLRQTEIRLNVPQVIRPDADFKADLALDGAQQENVMLELSIDRDEGGKFLQRAGIYRGTRQFRKSFRPAGPDGHPEFEITVSDWNIRERLPRIDKGRVYLRARVLVDGVPDKSVPVKFAEFYVDKTPPEVRFVQVGDQAVPRGAPGEIREIRLKKGREVRLKVEALEDLENMIERVYFWPGQPAKNERPQTIQEPRTGTQLDDQGREWQIDWFVNMSATNELVTVEVHNKAGLVAFDTVRLLLAPEPEKKENQTPQPPELGTIRGEVKTGVRSFPEETVELFKADDVKREAPVATATTDREGNFVFKDVEPGNYVVRVSAVGGRWVDGPVPVRVSPGQTATVQLKPKFKP